ncbi:hypothetical protein J4558_13925 [Leptolyngbya sp. 15MV]|nr:hypothetical protein J4558_13925 [Leptolyngbya sp. 15MV]
MRRRDVIRAGTAIIGAGSLGTPAIAQQTTEPIRRLVILNRRRHDRPPVAGVR